MPPGTSADERACAIAVEQHGSGEPLVLLHGLATTRVIWRRALPLLAPRRLVITLDVPGFGDSPPAGPGFELETVAARVADALAQAGISRPYDLVGHSMGGAIALTLAASDPALVRRLVLVAPAGLAPLPALLGQAFGVAAVRAIAVRRQGAPLAGSPWGRRLLMTPGTADPASVPPADVRAMLAASRGATRIAQALETVSTADLRPLVSTLPVPLGAVWGARDKIVPAGGVATLRALRPEAPVELVAGAGHIPMMERPQAFAQAIEVVLAALGAPTPAGNNSRVRAP